ncbi:MAG: Gfo/Idh/MocA family oxidoreductase [Boseongicola sp.]|nr:Gfo/Idh/MocA family oxidoreductase [Boseongicola sp.]
MPNPEPVRWGILGAAKFAREQSGPAIHMSKNATLAGLATSSAEKAEPFQALAPGLAVFDDYDALLVSPDIDAVYVPLPNHLHVEWTLKSIAAGKPVLTEKPIALTEAEYDTLIEARDASGVLAAEAYMIVHHPQWQQARDLVQSGAIGALLHVRGAFCYNNAADTRNIRNRPETGGGSIRDIGVYTMGSARFVSGQEPGEVRANLSIENGIDALAMVSADFPGFTLEAMTSMRLHPYQEMTFFGDKGTIRLTAPFNPGVYGEATVILTDGSGTRTWTYPNANHYVNQFEAFGHSIRNGAEYPCPLEFSRGTQRMIDMVFAAA